ncbi:MAG: DUF2264 domain-containing protein [Planctomycetota bacterium]
MSFPKDRPGTAVNPRTGLDRDGWLSAGRFLLQGVLQHVDDPDSPLLLPAHRRQGWDEQTVNLEALSRTFLLSSAMLGEDPQIRIAGVDVGDFYARQIAAAIDPASDRFIGHFDEWTAQRGRQTAGHTVEGAALAMGFWLAGEDFQQRFSPDQRDRMADWMRRTGMGRTNNHNWRWFNVMMLSYLASAGWEVDRDAIAAHVDNLLAWYAGDGWYRDGAEFDFYNAWTFQTYGPLWHERWGAEHMPDRAARIAENHHELMQTCAMLFSRDGCMPLWGRSCIYRCAAAAPLPAAFLLDRPGIDPGWARRVASGNLLQFITREETFDDGVATLGFYGPFEPMVQGYSQAASPYWLSKLFVALALPADSPFWQARENDGPWQQLEDRAQTVYLPGPGLCITSDGTTGQAELRAGKVQGGKSSFLYTRLAYSTLLGCQADDPRGASAGAYSVRCLDGDDNFLSNGGFQAGGFVDGVLYRQTTIASWGTKIDLADIILPGATLRVDRLRCCFAHDVRLGHFALPHVEGQAPEISEFAVGGMTGLTASAADGRSTAILPIAGWDRAHSCLQQGLGPETARSTLLYLHRLRETCRAEMPILVCLLRTSTDPIRPDQMDLVEEMDLLPYGARITLKTGQTFRADFRRIEGHLSC